VKTITAKTDIKYFIEDSFDTYYAHGLDVCVAELQDQILSQKVKTSLLEYCGEEYFLRLTSNAHLPFCDKLWALRTSNGNVIISTILQKRLKKHFAESIQKATDYVAGTDLDDVCNMIGKYIFSHALIYQPLLVIPEMKRLSRHREDRVIRSLGAGIDHAVKRGLNKEYTIQIFNILFSMADTQEKELRHTLGSAAKTIAQLHPDIIPGFKHLIEDPDEVPGWFRTKIKIGLNRNN
jgi:chorismate mutase